MQPGYLIQVMYIWLNIYIYFTSPTKPRKPSLIFGSLGASFFKTFQHGYGVVLLKGSYKTI